MPILQASATAPAKATPEAVTQPAPVTVNVSPTAGLPRQLTRQEISAIRSARSELSSQLSSASERRARLVEELKGTEGQVKAGLEQRLVVLDNRIAQIEQDIAETGRQLTDARIIETTQPARPFPRSIDPDVLAGVGSLLMFVFLAPVALAWARMWWRRSSSPAPARADHESSARLERIEQAVDAIAIEVERVSEAQRFQTKLLGEGQGIPAFAQSARPEEAVRPGGYGRD